jgi:predicted PurR-regulated permease PerM
MTQLLAGLTVRRVVLGTAVVLAVGAGFALLYFAGATLASLFLAILLGTALKPLVDRLEHAGASRVFATALVYVALLGVVAAFAVLIGPRIVHQVSELGAELPGYYARLRATLLASPVAPLRTAAARLPADLGAMGAHATPSLAALEGALEHAASLGRSLFVLTAVLVLGFYWTLEGDGAARAALSLLARDERNRAQALLRECERRIGGYVRGVTILCAAVGLVSFAAYTIIGLPNAIVFGVIAGVLEAVPVVGPIVAAVPPLLVALSIEPVLALWVLAAAVGIQTLENWVLVPRVMKGAVGINGFVTLLAITAFGALLGVAGALLAIPAAAIAQLLVDRLWRDVPEAGGAPAAPPGDAPGALAALREEAQSVAQGARALALSAPVDGPARAEAPPPLPEALEELAGELDRALEAQAEIEADRARGTEPAAGEAGRA